MLLKFYYMADFAIIPLKVSKVGFCFEYMDPTPFTYIQIVKRQPLATRVHFHIVVDSKYYLS